jgi:methylase of polypeptide subunit release factors
MSPKEALTTRVSRATQLRLFFSVDLVGGTAYKSRGPADDFSSPQSWPNRFEGFFRDFTRSFKEGVVSMRAGTKAALLEPPELWKINGDELLFTELVYPDKEQQHDALRTSLATFVELVQRTDGQYLNEGLGVRACAWTAGFPLRNKRLQIVQGGIRLLEAGRRDPETGANNSVPVTVKDYIGRDMDLGFRLAAEAAPGKVICSLDLAEFVLGLPAPKRLGVWHVGWAHLKGILDSQPYPLLWLEGPEPVEVRHPWDESDNAYADPRMRERLRSGNGKMTEGEFEELAKRVRALSAGQLIVPYASLEGMPPDHRREYEPDPNQASVRELRAGDGAAPRAEPEYAVSSAHAEPITLDDLNQMQMWLQDNRAVAGELARILHQIASHPTYRRWSEDQQFEGDLFRLHDSLAFASDQKRFLLETIALVKNDALRVRVNLRGRQVFITDGLWIDPSIRAFPFSDESDLVVRTCEEEDLMGWATTVIDPATGCGHNLLRYRGEGVRRYGFDLNARALAYAGINALLNGVVEPSLAVGDIHNGIPPVFDQMKDERILVVANMPFALVPNPEQIARSAQGGRYGYELTTALIDAIDTLRTSLSRSAELRCVILFYTVGNLAQDAWVVPRYAAMRFGKEHVRWKLWKDEKLWRVNGRKEQDNPMPLQLLKLKADCRFYVRGNVSPDALREEYAQLERELAAEGFDHLGYGVLTARIPTHLSLKRVSSAAGDRSRSRGSHRR